MGLTKLTNLINPEVMADMVSAALPKKIKFSPIAKIDDTLAAQPGDTITVPKYAYIGDAEDVAEGVAMGTTVLTASSTHATVKKAGKAVELTDESVLSGYGDPVGEATGQLTLSIAAKVDNDCLTALEGSSLVYDGTAAKIAYAGIVDASSTFEDEVDEGLEKVLFINPKQESTIRKDADFIDKSKSGMDVLVSGTIGTIGGCQIVKSKKVKKIEYEKSENGATTITAENIDTYKAKTLGALAVGDKVDAVAAAYYACPIVVVDSNDPNEASEADGVANEAPAITIYLKRGVEMESDRDILAKTTVLSADEHYTAVLSNESKVVLAKFKA